MWIKESCWKFFSVEDVAVCPSNWDLSLTNQRAGLKHRFEKLIDELLEKSEYTQMSSKLLN